MTDQTIGNNLTSKPSAANIPQETPSDGPQLLIIDDGKDIHRALTDNREDYGIVIAADRMAAMTCMEESAPQVVILDLGLPSGPDDSMESFTTLTDILQEAPLTKIIIISGNKDRRNAVKAIGLGAYDFHEKPIEPDILSLMIRRAFKLSKLEAENKRLSQHVVEGFHGIVTDSPKIHTLFRTVEKIANTHSNVLIRGESGTRKEMFAQALHNASPRAQAPFIPMNCGALSEELLEAELFGYEKGVFQNAVHQRKGKIESADQGTLFLDDIEDLPMNLQARLLNFIREKAIMRIGGDEQIPVDVRIICSTRSPSKKFTDKELFLKDLYGRLSEIILDVPPLRERDDDSYILAQYFMDAFALETGMAQMSLSPDAAAAIRNHPWPGNIRELENKIKRAMVLADGALITAADLHLPGQQEPVQHLTLRNAREAAERKVLRDAVELADGNLSQAAKLLQVSRPTVYNLIKSLGIKID